MSSQFDPNISPGDFFGLLEKSGDSQSWLLLLEYPFSYYYFPALM